MASRQKSFFDQKPKARPLWRKDLKHSNDDTRGPQPPPKPAATMSPIAASSQSKSKLRAFQYDQHVTQRSAKETEPEKENTNPEREKTGSQMVPPSQPLSQRSASKDLRECPQTPIGRLPLADLLASGDDTSRQHLNLTPIERVLWDNSPLSPQASSSIPLARKGRKRARSSSPASSSQDKTSKHFGEMKPSADLQALQKALKTPKADPADDLWSRYSLNTNPNEQQSPTNPTGLAFSHLMQSSSPQTPASHLQGRESGGLRRALSCIEWPTSIAKRRKLKHGRYKDITDGFTASEGGPDTLERSKMSRVSLLVDKIHEGLVKTSSRHAYSSSEPIRSSPVARKNEYFSERPSTSPQESLRVAEQGNEAAIDDVVFVLSQTAVASEEHIRQPLVLSDEEIVNFDKDGDSSDFGDDELDLEMLETVGAKIETCTSIGPSTTVTQNASGRRDTRHIAPVKDRRDGGNPGNLGPIVGDSGKQPAISSPPKPSSSTLQQAPSIRDEFDDDGNDVSAADLQDVFAKFDQESRNHVPGAFHRDLKKGGHGGAEIKADNKTVSTNTNDAERAARTIDIQSISDDDFGNDSDFEQIAAECVEATRKQQQVSQPQSSHDRKFPTIQRYIIKAVASSEYETNNGHRQPEKVLSVQNELTKLSKAIILRQAWVESPCSPGSFVHLIGDFDRFGQCVVDNTQNILIIHPDHLISSTVVGDSFTCTRKAVLQDRVKATSDANQATLYGHMLHEIFQEALRANRWDDDFMASIIEAIATRNLENLFEIQIEHVMAVEQLRARAVDLQAWAEIFVAARPKSNAVIRDRNGAQSLMSVNKLLEVEEKVWSPVYGLKGNVDATIQVLLEDGNEEKTLTVPFELKTGKHQSAAHKAQTSLYTLLLSDRYDVDIACGILYYMQTSEICSIPTIRHELVPMIMQRNELASYVRHCVELPPMIKRPYICGKCYAQTPCFIYHKLVDDGNGETSGMGEKFEDLVKHLSTQHQLFFSKWDDLLTKEEKDVVKFRKELWTMQSSEREKAGRCFGNLLVEPESFHEVEGAPKINRFRYNFVKQKPTPGFTFTESQITLGEPIVISDEKGHFALANGYVTSLRKHKIQVTVDRRLHNARVKSKGFDARRYQSFTGIMEIVESSNGQSSTVTPTQPEESVLYRLDKDEFSNGMAMIRNNLIRLMEKDVFGVQALRRLVVDGVAPTFKPAASQYTLKDTVSQASLNIDQKAAIEKVMNAKDYALVLGMPGTGKTTTIAHIIRALVAQGKSVLLTSYTHTAVDNILLKLRNDGVGIFRLGAVAKVYPEVQEFADLAGRPITTIEDLKRCYTQPIVATTCLGISHPIFNQRVFDYCIVDEASQITLPVCLGPIRMARTFILVGDHYQLPPLVQNKEALDGGLDISLFKTLSDNHPSSVVNLEHQYRMCEDVMTLSNTLIYGGRLKCGTSAVANRSITIPNMNALKQHHHNSLSSLSVDPTKICANPSRGSCWLRDLLDPSVKSCFVDTDPLLPHSREVLENGGRITNLCEATLATQLVESLITTGVPPTDIGVITLYRSQLALIKQSLRHRPGVEMHTADKFQGRDKEVVVLSLVRSNESQVVGELLKDWRRVNVALTRARTKLLVLGSKTTLVGNELLKDFVALMEGKGWLYGLPTAACEGHIWEDGGTQISGRGSGEAKMEEAKVQSRSERPVLGEGKENKMGKRLPAKQAKLDMKALMGKRPVLRDIVNDAS